jgi:hypothetical protein
MVDDDGLNQTGSGEKCLEFWIYSGSRANRFPDRLGMEGEKESNQGDLGTTLLSRMLLIVVISKHREEQLQGRSSGADIN